MDYQDKPLPPERMAATAYEVFRRTMGNRKPDGSKMPDCRDLPDKLKYAWSIIAEEFTQKVENLSGKMFAQIAQIFYNRFETAQARHPDWEALDLRAKVAWEAVVRHMANMMLADADTDLGPHEVLWDLWATKEVLKRAPPGPTVKLPEAPEELLHPLPLFEIMQEKS